MPELMLKQHFLITKINFEALYHLEISSNTQFV
jgi:hypothetical protein